MVDSGSRLHLEDVINSWGLLRRPLIYTDASISRLDLITMAASAGLVPILLWLMLMLISSPLAWLMGVGGTESLAVCTILYGSMIVLGLVWPVARVKTGSLVGAFITFSRFKGNLAGADKMVLIFSAGAIVCIIFGGTREVIASTENYYPRAPVAIPLVFLMVGAFLGASLNIRMRVLGVVARGKTVPISEWLRRLQGESVIPAANSQGPESGSSFEYEFPVNNPDGGRIGVVVHDDILQRLRQLNLEYEGRLFKESSYKKTLAVVQGIQKPVNGTGAGELSRLAMQMCSRAVALGVTPMQFANEILRVVQYHIEYVSDDVSTAKILGRPMSEYGRFPLETLVDGEGDCECSALLCAALLSYCGLPSLVLYVTVIEDGEEGYHAAVGLKGNTKMFPMVSTENDTTSYIVYEGDIILYGETTSAGDGTHGFGSIPLDWRNGLKVRSCVTIPACEGAILQAG